MADKLTDAIAAAAKSAPRKSPTVPKCDTIKAAPKKGRKPIHVTIDAQSPAPQIVSIAEAARMLGFDRDAFYGWFKQGCPRHENGVIISEVVAWREAKSAASASRTTDNMDLEEAELRLARAKAEKAELELAALRKTMITIEDAIAAIAPAISDIRAALRMMAPSLMQKLSHTSDPAECERIVADEVTRVLSKLSGVDLITAGSD